MKYIARSLRRRWRASLAIVLVLALGLGATAAMFSALDQVLLRSLPFPQSDRLVTVHAVTYPGIYEIPFQIPMYADVSASHDVFAMTAAYVTGDANFQDPRAATRVHVAHATPSFFSTLGIQPATGRAFRMDDTGPGAPLVAIISQAFRTRVFGADSALGRTLTIQGNVFTVIGVMPPGFTFPGQSDLWVPLADPIRLRALSAPIDGDVTILSRLAPGVSTDAAARRVSDFWNQDAALIARSDSAANANFRQERQNEIEYARGPLVRSLQAELAGTSRKAAFVLFGVTVLLLLIVCANVANLLIAQGIERRQEIATRAALGATRRRLIGALLLESVPLGVLGAVLGLAVAAVLLRVVGTLLPVSLTVLLLPHLDLRIAAFALAAGLLCALSFGLWPAVTATSTNLAEALGTGGSHTGTGKRNARGRTLLMVGELGLSVLLVGSALAVLQQFAHLTGADTGIRSKGVGTLDLSFGQDVRSGGQRLATFQAILAQLRNTPGIQAAALVTHLAASEDQQGSGMKLHGVSMRWIRCSGEYFKVMGIPLLEGRTFASTDDSVGPSVVIVDKALADSLWPGLDPIGRNLPIGKRGDRAGSTVVGVVGTARQDGLLGDNYHSTLYQPIGQSVPWFVALVARSEMSDAVMLTRMQQAVHTAAPALPAFNVRAMRDVFRDQVASERVQAQLISLFGTLALLIAALGVYAVVAFSTTQRRRAIAIHAALGASRTALVRAESRKLLYMLTAGVGLGVFLAWAAKRGVQPLLTQPLASVTGAFLAGAVVVVVAAVLAAVAPVRRAIALDPARVLREP